MYLFYFSIRYIAIREELCYYQLCMIIKMLVYDIFL